MLKFISCNKDNCMNTLFNKLVGVIRQQQQSSVIPFATGRIYSCTYRNWKHDPKPLLLVIGSDSFYTVGINLHYVPQFYANIENWIIMMRNSQKILTGKIIYDVMKMRIPMVPKTAYRKYFTSMLRGKLVSSGLYTGPEPTAFQFFADPFVKRLNNKINAFTMRGKPATTFNNKELDDVRNQIQASQYDTNGQQPFANRTQKTVVQYRQPGDNNGIS